jgi:hypothetical protein
LTCAGQQGGVEAFVDDMGVEESEWKQ